MAEFKFYIDAVEVAQPKGWDTFETGYTRILDTRGATIAKPEGELTFVEDGYDALNTLWTDEGPCGQATFKITYREGEFDTFATLFEGIIRGIDIEFDLFNCTAKVAQIVDNSYISLINTNADVRAYPNVGRSKNDVSITAVTAINIDFFDPSSLLGTYNYPNRKCYRVFDVFEFLVAFCTDGGLTFASTFFDTGGEAENIFIVTGEALGGTSDEPPFVSFAELLLEMHYLFNVVVVIDDSGATPAIRVESAADTYEETVTQQFQSADIRGLRKRGITFGSGSTPFSGDKPISVFTDLKVGSATTLSDSGGFQYPDILWISHKEEEYHILGDCGFKQTLEMVNNYVIDSNVFEDLLVTPSTAYDSNIFVVETDYPAFNRATQFDIITPGAIPYTYNDGLTNRSRMDRFIGAIPGSIARYLGNGNDGFQAQQTINIPYVPPGPLNQQIIFDDDFTPPNNDPNGNYAVGTGLYTCPVAGAGAYTFKTTVRFVNVVIDAISAPSYNYTLTIRRNITATGGTEDKTQTGTITGDTTLSFEPSAFYLDAGDTVEVRILVTNSVPGPGGGFDIDQSYFLTTQVQSGGGIYQTTDLGTYRGSYYLFEVPMSFADFLTMVDYSQRFDAVFVNFGDTSRDVTGWIVQARYKIGDAGGMATIELVSTA